MILTSVLLAFLPLASAPEAEGVSSRQMLKWIAACETKIDAVHGFVLLKNGKLVAEGSWAPFDTIRHTHRLSSHSKCIVSTAAGFLVDDGKLDLDEYVVDILPDLMPKAPSENLRRLRVRDLMTMTMGSEKASEGWPAETAPNWLKYKLAIPIKEKPGQHYHYDSDATHVLGEVVARKAGQPLMDFLKLRLFGPLGMDKAWSTVDPNGKPCAGWGFNLTTREIASIGQLYLDKGVWNGQRLLSEDWTTLATTKQTWSGKTPKDFQPKNDWTYGFGFNFWRCQHGCYRADGAGGQFTIVFPEHQAVLSLHADVDSMQQLLDIVWDDFLPALSTAPLAADAEGAAQLAKRCRELAFTPIAGSRTGGEKWLGRVATCKKPIGSVKTVRADATDDGWQLTFETEAGKYVVPVGYGTWKTGEMVFSPRPYEICFDIIGKQRVAASGAVQDDGSLRIRMHLLDGSHRFDFYFKHQLLGDVVGFNSPGITWGKIVTAPLK